MDIQYVCVPKELYEKIKKALNSNWFCKIDGTINNEDIIEVAEALEEYEKSNKYRELTETR